PGLLCELVRGNLDNLLISENGEHAWERNGSLLVYCSLKPEVHSTRTGKCHPFDLPVLRHSESGVEHVEISLQTPQRALAGGEASCDIDNTVDLVLLADLPQVRGRSRVRLF